MGCRHGPAGRALRRSSPRTQSRQTCTCADHFTGTSLCRHPLDESIERSFERVRTTGLRPCGSASSPRAAPVACPTPSPHEHTHTQAQRPRAVQGRHALAESLPRACGGSMESRGFGHSPVPQRDNLGRVLLLGVRQKIPGQPEVSDFELHTQDRRLVGRIQKRAEDIHGRNPPP